jgi:hypothetical protein
VGQAPKDRRGAEIRGTGAGMVRVGHEETQGTLRDLGFCAPPGTRTPKPADCRADLLDVAPCRPNSPYFMGIRCVMAAYRCCSAPDVAGLNPDP